MKTYKEEIGKVGIIGDEKFVQMMHQLLKDSLTSYSLNITKPSYNRNFQNHCSWFYVFEERERQ